MRLIQNFLSMPALTGALLTMIALNINPIAQAESATPSLSKLDLRTATEAELRQVIAHISEGRVTIVAFAGTDAPWRIVQDAGEQLAVMGIPVSVAWAKDEDDDIQTANVVVFAKGQGRDGVEYSTRVGYINYRIHVEDGAVDRLISIVSDVSDTHFARD